VIANEAKIQLSYTRMKTYATSFSTAPRPRGFPVTRVATVLAVNVGDTLRDTLDPRLEV
jgi:hypothetical protein